jgi:hypothetical protein
MWLGPAEYHWHGTVGSLPSWVGSRMLRLSIGSARGTRTIPGFELWDDDKGTATTTINPRWTMDYSFCHTLNDTYLTRKHGAQWT